MMRDFAGERYRAHKDYSLMVRFRAQEIKCTRRWHDDARFCGQEIECAQRLCNGARFRGQEIKCARKWYDDDVISRVKDRMCAEMVRWCAISQARDTGRAKIIL